MSAIVLTTLSLEYVAPTNFWKTIILCHDIIFLTHWKCIATRQYIFSKPIGFLHVGIQYQSLTNDLVKNCQVENELKKLIGAKLSGLHKYTLPKNFLTKIGVLPWNNNSCFHSFTSLTTEIELRVVVADTSQPSPSCTTMERNIFLIKFMYSEKATKIYEPYSILKVQIFWEVRNNLPSFFELTE